MEIGVLQTSSKISYEPPNKKKSHYGKQPSVLKKFITHDNKRELLVKTTKIYHPYDHYVIVNPSATIFKYIGVIGDPQAEYDYIENIALMGWSRSSIYIPLSDQFLQPDSYASPIISIDPPNCIDIDDALSVTVLPFSQTQYYQIGIHIADVTAYVLPDSDLDKELQKRAESIYLTNQYNMLPDELVKLVTLSDNKNSRAFSLYITLDIDGNIHSHKFVKNIVRVTKNMSYDEAQDIIDGKNSTIAPSIINSLTLLYSIGNKIAPTNQYDTHKMVETFMILANKLAGETIYKYDATTAIMRNHTSHTQNISNTITTDIPPIIISKAGQLNMGRAEYCIGTNNTGHMGLNAKYYTHFTSPMRRYVDILVHRALNNAITNTPPTPITSLQNILTHCNTQHKLYNRCQELYNRNKIIFSIDNQLIETMAYIVGFADNRIFINVPDLELDLSLYPIMQKLTNIATIDITDEHMKITTTDNRNHIILKVFDKIAVKIAITLRSTKKINIVITSPNIQALFE